MGRDGIDVALVQEPWSRVNKVRGLRSRNLNLTSPQQANLSLFKRANGYRPFLYNVTLDACDFMKNLLFMATLLVFALSFEENFFSFI
uniref:Uncharacterized protein n=1 Tax=Stomoxys calcitrans TaxID=35570 RepID=A0A1I8Q9H7_STOCA